eukprot:7144922-Prymnesium_polylepis.1
MLVRATDQHTRYRMLVRNSDWHAAALTSILPLETTRSHQDAHAAREELARVLPGHGRLPGLGLNQPEGRQKKSTWR